MNREIREEFDCAKIYLQANQEVNKDGFKRVLFEIMNVNSEKQRRLERKLKEKKGKEKEKQKEKKEKEKEKGRESTHQECYAYEDELEQEKGLKESIDDFKLVNVSINRKRLEIEELQYEIARQDQLFEKALLEQSHFQKQQADFQKQMVKLHQQVNSLNETQQQLLEFKKGNLKNLEMENQFHEDKVVKNRKLIKDSEAALEEQNLQLEELSRHKDLIQQLKSEQYLNVYKLNAIRCLYRAYVYDDPDGVLSVDLHLNRHRIQNQLKQKEQTYHSSLFQTQVSTDYDPRKSQVSNYSLNENADQQLDRILKANSDNFDEAMQNVDQGQLNDNVDDLLVWHEEMFSNVRSEAQSYENLITLKKQYQQEYEELQQYQLRECGVIDTLSGIFDNGQTVNIIKNSVESTKLIDQMQRKVQHNQQGVTRLYFFIIHQCTRLIQLVQLIKKASDSDIGELNTFVDSEQLAIFNKQVLGQLDSLNKIHAFNTQTLIPSHPEIYFCQQQQKYKGIAKKAMERIEVQVRDLIKHYLNEILVDNVDRLFYDQTMIRMWLAQVGEEYNQKQMKYTQIRSLLDRRLNMLTARLVEKQDSLLNTTLKKLGDIFQLLQMEIQMLKQKVSKPKEKRWKVGESLSQKQNKYIDKTYQASAEKNKIYYNSPLEDVETYQTDTKNFDFSEESDLFFKLGMKRNKLRHSSDNLYFAQKPQRVFNRLYKQQSNDSKLPSLASESQDKLSFLKKLRMEQQRKPSQLKQLKKFLQTNYESTQYLLRTEQSVMNRKFNE